MLKSFYSYVSRNRKPLLLGGTDILDFSSVSKKEWTAYLSLNSATTGRRLAAAALRKLTETDGASLRNISGLRQADPASMGPRKSSIRENTKGVNGPLGGAR